MSALPHEGALREPFSLTASPDDYVPTASIERVLADARAALDAGRVPVIAGPTGLGKTLVLQLLGRASAPGHRALYVPFCNLAPDELAELVLGLLEWPGGPDPERALLDAASRSAHEGRPLVLLVDDAAALSGESAAHLAHWRSASGGDLNVVLAGLPGASLRHARDAFGDRAEEILLSGGIRPDELRGYVDARLESAGAEPAIRAAFDDGALAELARVSGGNPRRLHLAAQAIVRNAYGTSVEAEAAGRQEAPASPDDSGARMQPRWDDLASVGEYRFVRGRFVGGPDAGEVAPAREEILAGGRQEDAPRGVEPEPELEVDPEPVRAAERAPEQGIQPEPDVDPALEPLLDEDEVPIDAGLGVDAGAEPEAPPIPPPVYAPPAPRSRGGSLRWVAAGIAVVAFGVGVWSQLEDDDASPIADEGRAAPIAVVPAPADPAPADEPAAVPAPEPAAAIEEVRESISGETAESATEAALAPEVAPEVEVAVEPDAPLDAPLEPEAQAAAAPAPDPAPAPAPEAIVPPAETVAIAINATPWAVIEIDGEEIGETPLAGIELTTGRHRFRARMPDGSIRERVVRIDADTPTVVFE